MRKATILTITMLTYFIGTAQTSDTWLTFLDSIKQEFYLKDTIVFSYNPITNNNYTNYLKLVKGEACKKLFKLGRELFDCSRERIFFYSYNLSKNNFATLTFFQMGRYAPVLTLYNYSPTGQFLNRVEVKSSFMDAGLADSISTRFTSGSTFVQSHWEGWEAIENGKSVLVDSVTTTNYSIQPHGQIVKGKQYISRRTR